jgi:hypothetical protein
MMTTGTISGERASALTIVEPGSRPRARPRATIVPKTVARIAVRTATSTLFTIPDDHWRSVSIRSYHWSVKPWGGKLRILACVKLIGTITRVGASR